ncbi:nitrate ABC transporter substrate-binding protein [candidate division KSB1 bacterium]
MKSKLTIVLCVVFSIFISHDALAQKPEYLTMKPMFQMTSVTAKAVSVRATGKVKVPLITWGGDVADVYAGKYGIFTDEGLDIELFLENNFLKQVEGCLSGETPYLRGTMGMINSAAEIFQRNNLELVVIYQKTWSTGGDAMVVRPGKNLANIKSVAIQQYGPHMDYVAKLFKDKKRNLKDISFKWLRELTVDYPEAGQKVLDPVSAFPADTGLDATMCIIPDALALTSGGNVGDGSAGTVKGAEILLSTLTAGTIISDVIAVRKDWFDANKGHAQKLTHALFRAEEDLRDLLKNKDTRQADYRGLLSEAAAILWGTSAGGSEIEALLGDCTYVGYNGNVTFFTGKGTTRNFKTLTDEIQASFIEMGIMTKRVPLYQAEWNYSGMASGLKYANVAAPAVVTPKFDTKKVAAAMEKKINVEAESFGEKGTLFSIEVNFAPNQNEFSESMYASSFEEAMSLSQTYSGALITVEGHSDPLGIQGAIAEGQSQPVINRMISRAKNLSLDRSNAVKTAFISYCKAQGINIDESQFYAAGFGISNPKYKVIDTEAKWAANRRVVFRIMQVEAELTEFKPIKK